MENEQKKRTSDIHIINDSNISTSILSIPSFIKTSLPTKHTLPIPKVTILPAFHDPLFINYIFYLPDFISFLIKENDKLPFQYCHISNENIEVYKNDKLQLTLNTLNYGNEICKLSLHNIFVFNKKKYIKTYKQQQIKLYKHCIENKIKYEMDIKLEEYKTALLQKQIDDNINLFFIENLQELIASLKGIVKNNDVKCKNYIKMKSFKEPMKYLECVIGNIPGIGCNVGRSVARRFKNLYNFYVYVMNEEGSDDKMENIIVYSKDGTAERKLGCKQADIIRKVLMSEDRNEHF